MKFLCDVHISIQVSKKLQEMGFYSEHVNNILDKWHTKDHVISQYVDENDFILITKDQDFRNTFLLHRTPKKLVKINLGNITNKDLMKVFAKYTNALDSLNRTTDSFMVEIGKDDFLTVTK